MPISLSNPSFQLSTIKQFNMSFDDIFLLLLDTIDLSQALSLGLFFSLVYRKKKSHLLYLGIFLISIGFSSLLGIIEQLGQYSHYKILTSLPFNLFLIIPCFLYLYVSKTSVLKIDRIVYISFIPGILDIIFGTSIILFADDPIRFQEESFYSTFQILGILYFPIIVILILIHIRKNTRLIKEQYSSTEHRDLNWVSTLVVSIIIYLITIPFIFISTSTFIGQLLDTIFWMYITYWAAYNGLLQQSSKNLIQDLKPHSSDTSNSLIISQNSKQVLTEIATEEEEKYNIIYSKIENLVKEKELFLNPELTIADLANEINEHPKMISYSINTIGGKNFNRFINQFRVERAKSILLTNRIKSVNIESIGQESGFKSNSSFYTAFKKDMNLTPLQFMKSQNTSHSA